LIHPDAFKKYTPVPLKTGQSSVAEGGIKCGDLPTDGAPKRSRSPPPPDGGRWNSETPSPRPQQQLINSENPEITKSRIKNT